MMVAVFAAMLLTFTFGWFGHRQMAAACLVVCLGLSVWLFLFEVYSPDYGFRMPWIQTQFRQEAPAAQTAAG